MAADPDERVASEVGPTSHLFTIRLWPEALGGGGAEWRGKVQHVTSGEVRYFRDWETLVAFLEAMLTEPGKGRPMT